MKKVKRVKFKLKLKNVLIFLVIVFVSGLVIYSLANKRINNIYIKGNNVLREQDILELLDLNDYKKYYQISTNSYEKRLKTSPLIKEVKVKKTLLSLSIDVLEYDILWYQEYDDSVVLSNGESVYLEEKVLGVPVVINQVDVAYFDQFVEQMSGVNKEILAKISEISYEPSDVDKERFLLYMNDQNYIYLTLNKFDYINKYDDLLPELSGKKGILYLDSGNHFQIMK